MENGRLCHSCFANNFTRFFTMKAYIAPSLLACDFAEIFWRRGCVVQYADIGRCSGIAYNCDARVAVQGVETRKDKYHLI
jgi:hypothetical protein